MAITFRHDAAAVVPPSNSATRKYGQQLVLQQQQQKYAAQQAGYDRMFDAYKQQAQNQFQVGRDNAQAALVLERDKAEAGRMQQQAEMKRQQAFMDDARKQEGRFIMDSIEAGEYDPNTARELRQNLIDEAEALGNPNLDATQRAEALSKIRSRRSTLSANRMPKKIPPTAQEEFDQSIVTRNGIEYRRNSKGDFEPLEDSKATKAASDAQAQGPKTADEAFRADPKLRDKYMEQAITIETQGGEKTLDREIRRKAVQTAKELYNEDMNFGEPAAAPEKPGGWTDPAAPGQSRSILEGPTAQLPDPGQPPAPTPTMSMDQYRAQMEQQGYKLVTPEDGTSPYYLKDSSAQGQYGVQTPQMAARPDEGQPPAPSTSTSTSQSSAVSKTEAAPNPTPPQQVKVNGRPLTVSPGTLTPQETAARDEIMKMPREERIAKLIPYDPELKGKTLDQILEDPATKAGYDELTKQGLTTGNYREDMLTQLDEMLQHNVMKGAGTTPQNAYVGMRADSITDPKVKAEVAKLPRPKSADERATIRSGQLYVDPDGIIRTRA